MLNSLRIWYTYWEIHIKSKFGKYKRLMTGTMTTMNTRMRTTMNTRMRTTTNMRMETITKERNQNSLTTRKDKNEYCVLKCRFTLSIVWEHRLNVALFNLNSSITTRLCQPWILISSLLIKTKVNLSSMLQKTLKKWKHTQLYGGSHSSSTLVIIFCLLNLLLCGSKTPATWSLSYPPVN